MRTNMEKKCRLLVSVHDQNLIFYFEAKVEIRLSKTGRWRRVRYNSRLERFVIAGLAPGEYTVQITGKRGWTRDERTIKLHIGDNFINSAIGPRNTPYYEASDGEKVFFKPDGKKMLLYAQGANLHEIIPSMIKKAKLKLSDPIVAPGQEVQPDNALFLVLFPSPATEREKALERLHNLVQKQFPQAGLTGRLAAPMFRGENVIEGMTNELIVRFKSEVTEEQAQQFAKRNGCTIQRRITYLGNAYLWRYRDLPDYDLLKIARELMARYPVVYAEPNIIFQITMDVYNPNDFLYPEQPHFQVINADDAWDTLDDINVNLRSGSPNITIAVFDVNGVDPTHPDLTGNLTDGSAKMSENFDFANMANQTFANLSGDHGTKCASSATAMFDNTIGGAGLAGNCHLIGARLPNVASGLDMADAWIWAAGFTTGSTNPNFPAQLTTGAEVISNSWGITWGALTNAIRDTLDFLTVYGRAGKGCAVCFSIGNLGYVQFSNRRTYAAYERTIAVGSSINVDPTNPCDSVHPDHNGNVNNLPAVVDTRAYYSPYGPELDIVGPSHTSYDATGDKVDPIVSAFRVNQGTWIGQAVTSRTTSVVANIGDTVVNVNNTAGFAVGEYALIGTPGAATREFVRINAVGVGQLTVDALQNAYPVGTQVSTGPNDYDRNFGGTSHSCPTVAGAAALILSIRPELTWVQVREILRTTAVRIDVGQANAIGQWVDNDGDGVAEFSQWYGYGRLDVDAAVIAARDLSTAADIVVRDNLNDTGAVPATGWHAHSPDLWVRQNNDPIPALAYNANPPHENPVRGQDNFVYMRVKNVGTADSNEVYLRTYIKHYAGFDFTYPDEWQPTTRPGDPIPTPLVPGTYLIGEERIDNLAINDDIIVKMTWEANLIPPDTVMVGGVNVKWHPCLLAEVSPHDGPPPATTGFTYEVMRDNNLAQRNISIDEPTTGDDFAVAVVAGTSDPVGIEAVLIDRSFLPPDYRVFVRIADKRHMLHWIKLLEGDELKATKPLPGSPYEKPEPAPKWPYKPSTKGTCKVTLLDSTRLGIDCCDGNAIVIHAPARTQIELLCRSGERLLGRPKLHKGVYQGQDVIFFDGGSQALELPLRLGSREFIPVIFGLMRPASRRGGGILKITQRRGDDELSAGYTIEG